MADQGDVHTKPEPGKRLEAAAKATALIIIAWLIGGFVWFSIVSQAYTAEEMLNVVVAIGVILLVPVFAVVWLLLFIWEVLTDHWS